jgi:hypothetical protein
MISTLAFSLYSGGLVAVLGGFVIASLVVLAVRRALSYCDNGGPRSTGLPGQ